MAWRFEKNLPYVPAPVLYEGIIYMVKSGGILTAVDAATGAEGVGGTPANQCRL